ncbi:MAG TPA: hypothetical protein VNM91_08030 [Dehalococcoidia bacterium]|nr:hypothetical protein [Dehalococcoidia bacterium]
MTSSVRAPITSFPRGHEFPPATFTLTADRVTAYLAAVGDEGTYGDAVPPLAAVALGLAALQERISLPDGSLHTGQEVEHEAPVSVGAGLTLRARVAQRSERQGMVISVIEFEIGEGSATCIRARSTIMAPGGAS